jgi:hypothetical protein
MTVSAEVAAALAGSGLAPEAETCLGTLAWGEGGVSFMTLYGGALYTGPLDHFPTAAEWPGGTGPTSQPTSALGFLQFERDTYAECTAATGLAGIDPQSQIANGWWLAQHDYTKRTMGGDLLAALKADRLGEVASALLSTWPGGANPEPNPTTGFPGFPVAYAAFLATLPTSSPPPPLPPPPLAPPPPPPPAADPVATALAALTSAFDHLSSDVGLALALIGAPNPNSQTIAAQIADITVRVSSLSDSIEQALAQGQSAPSFRR